MRLSADDIEAKRALILEKGRELMTKQGYAGTGVSEIAREVGMPKGSFFNYFDPKEDFVIQVVRTYSCEHAAYMTKVLQNTSLSPLQRLRTYYENVTRMLIQSLDFRGGCLLNGLSTEVSDYNDNIRVSIADSYQAFYKPLEACIAEGQEAGEISADHDPKQLALFIDNSWRGILTTGKASRDSAAVDAFLKYIFEYLLK